MFYPKVNKEIIALLIVLFSCGAVAGCHKEVKEDSGPKPRLVEVIPVKHGQMSSSVGFTGNLYSKNEISVLPRISGQVLEVLVDEGDQVSEGQVLLRINDDLLQAQKRQLEANLSAAQTQYQMALSGYQLQDSQVSVGINQADQSLLQTKFNSEQIKLNMQQAKTDFDRIQRLYDKGAVSKQDLENAQLRYDTSVKQYETSQSMIKNANEGLKMANANTIQKAIRSEEISAAKAQMDSLQANIDLVNININDCQIKAPFSGVISYRDKTVAKGAIVSANPAAPIFKIVDNSNLYMEGTVSEGVISSVKNGDSVKVLMDSFPGKTFSGKVDTIVQAIDSKSMAFTVRVIVDNASNELKAGMFGRADIYVATLDGVVVPAFAIMKKPYLLTAPKKAEDEPLKPLDEIKDNSVYCVFVAENGKAVRKNLKVGASSETEFLVTGGITDKDNLKDGDKIIITSVKTLQDQELIKISDSKKNS